jgi:hypothetical protein
MVTSWKKKVFVATLLTRRLTEAEGRLIGEWRRRGTMSEPRIIKLPRTGPQPGQSMDAWLYGKSKSEQEQLDHLRWQRGADSRKAP